MRGGDLVKEILDFILTFSSVLWEAMPFIVLGALIAGILEEFLPQEAITKFLPKAVIPSVMIGALLGLIFPMCECGIVVVMRRLLKKGLPLSCCIAYMLAGPIINFVVIGSTWIAFKDHKIEREVVAMRVGLGFVVAVITGLVVHGQWKKYGTKLLAPSALPPVSKPGLSLGMAEDAPAPKPPFMQRLGNISSTALHDFVDITVFLILGAVLAALAKQYIKAEQIESISTGEPFLAIAAMMLMSFLMSLCSEADAFVAASFTRMHISAKLAFLVLGPMLDIKLILMYTRVFKPRLILTIVTCVVIQVLLYCFAIHMIYQAKNWTGMPG